MRRSILCFVTLLCLLPPVYAIEDGADVRDGVRDAYKAWDATTERANRDYQRKVLAIRQQQVKQLEKSRDRLAKSKRYDEVAAYTDKIKQVEEQVATLKELVRLAAPPDAGVTKADTGAEPTDERPQGKADWYRGKWTLKAPKTRDYPRVVDTDGKSVSNSDDTGKIIKADADSLVIAWSDGPEERWYRHPDGVVFMVQIEDGEFTRMGALSRD